MVQMISNRAWQAEARTEETRDSIREVKRVGLRKFSPEEKIRIVLEGVSGATYRLETSAVGKAFVPTWIMPGSKISWKLVRNAFNVMWPVTPRGVRWVDSLVQSILRR